MDAWIPLVLYQGTWCLTESIFVARFRGGRLIEKNNRHSAIPLATGILALAVVIISAGDCLLLSKPDQVFYWSVSGWFIGLPGIVLRLLAIRQLGPRFLDQIILLPDHKIDKQGVYRFLNHPAEIGFCLAILGFIVMCQSGAGLIVFLGGLLPLSLRRMALEDRMIARAES